MSNVASSRTADLRVESSEYPESAPCVDNQCSVKLSQTLPKALGHFLGWPLL